MVRTLARRPLLKFSLAAAVALAPAAALTVQAQAQPAPTTKVAAQASAHAYTAGRYIVTFTDDAAASYTGYAKGYAATRPARGHKTVTRAVLIGRDPE